MLTDAIIFIMLQFLSVLLKRHNVYGQNDRRTGKTHIFAHKTLMQGSNCASVDQDPVVQSIVSLTSSLRDHLVKCFTTLSPNTLIFLLKK